MSRKRPLTPEPHPSAAELGPDDGADPKRTHDARTWTADRQAGRKARQLCEQVADALRSILPGMADDALRDLTVVLVEPAPHTGRLLVTVAGPAPADVTDPFPRTAVLDRLARAAGRLRAEVAASVHRRKAPELVFRVL